MKTKLQFIIALIAVAAIGFTGCEKDNNEGSIVGKWEAESTSYKYWKNDVLQDEGTESYSSGELLIEFKSDKTYVVNMMDDGQLETETGTYSVSGNKITIVSPEDGESSSEFSISNNKLTISDKGEESDNNIKYRWEDTTVFKKK